MAFHLPNLAWLRAFEASARHLSFTAAANELQMTQAAVSHQVRALERQLGFPLFDRLARGLRLTDLGGAYLPSVQAAFQQLEGATDHLFGAVRQRAVSVRAPVSLAVLWIAPRLVAFRQAHPAIGVRLFSSLWSDALSDDQIDVEIRFGTGQWRGCESTLLFCDAAHVIAPRGWAEGDDEAERIRALAHRPIVHVIGHEDLWQTAFWRAGIDAPSPPEGIRVDTSLAAIELVAAGAASAVILSVFLERALAQMPIEAPDVEPLSLDLGHYIVRPLGGVGSAPSSRAADVDALVQWLVEEARPVRERTPQSGRLALP